MSVSGIGSTSSLSSTLEILAARTSQATSADAASASATSTELSGPAQWMSQLEDLASTDPEKFKSATASIADKLKALAQSATGGEASALSDLADRFAQASKDGTTDALKPQGGPPPGPPPGDAAGKVQRYTDQQSSDRDSEMQAFFTSVDQLVQGQIGGASA